MISDVKNVLNGFHSHFAGVIHILVAVEHILFFLHQREKEEVPFSMAIRNEEPAHARVFSQTFAHGNISNKISQINRRKR